MSMARLSSHADAEEAVVARVISSLTSLASLGLLPRMRLWDVFFIVRGFLCHPNAWIRQGEWSLQEGGQRLMQGTAGFIAAAARNLSQADVWCILYPSLRTLLHSDILEMDEEGIMVAVISPVGRPCLSSEHPADDSCPERPLSQPSLLRSRTRRPGSGKSPRILPAPNQS